MIDRIRHVQNQQEPLQSGSVMSIELQKSVRGERVAVAVIQRLPETCVAKK